MTDQHVIQNKENFEACARDYLNTLFGPAIEKGFGEIDIRIFPKNGKADNFYYSSINEVVEKAYNLCNSGIDVYVGVNPRIGKKGNKINVHYLVAFHAEIDYGIDGHKKASNYKNKEEAYSAICCFKPEPSIVVHSGGGFHCYWVLYEPVKISDVVTKIPESVKRVLSKKIDFYEVLEDPNKTRELGIGILESINKTLAKKIGGDSGTHDISRVLRIPGTYNFKIPDKPRYVKMISNSGKKYDWEDFEEFINEKYINIKTNEDNKKNNSVKKTEVSTVNIQSTTILNELIEGLNVSPQIKSLIYNGNDGSYLTRSHADMAVICSLLKSGMTEQIIKQVFNIYLVGDKYRGHQSPDKYLQHTINAAREYMDLTDEELQNPLFISKAIYKEKDKYCLNRLRFEEYIVKKHKIKFVDSEGSFYKYNGRCYEVFPYNSFNALCQGELKKYREHLGRETMKDIQHFAIGDPQTYCSKNQKDRFRYLTLKNGLYDLDEKRLIPHTPEIFTTNFQPFYYDPNAKCPRFLLFLNEVFWGDTGKIDFIQEALGYCLFKSLPTPMIIFLTGIGRNGKSVLIDVIYHLVGKENVANVGLRYLSNEYYLLEFFGKLVNISSETPNNRQMETDIVKAVVSGDLVSGRRPYEKPVNFKPYAKNFFSMNELPPINDHTHGMWRRVYVVEFPRVFSDENADPFLINKLIPELSGIFNWALDGLERLRSNNFVFTKSKSMMLAKDEYRNENSSAFSFINQNLAKSDNKNDRLKFGDVFEKYKEFCESEGYNEEKLKKFKRILIDSGYGVKKSTKDGNQLFIFGVKAVY